MFNKKAFNRKKSIAVALAFSTFINLFGMSTNTAQQAEAKSSVSTSENKLVRFIKNHPVLTTVGATATFVGLCAGATILTLIPKNKTKKINYHDTDSHTNDSNTDTDSHTNDSNTDTDSHTNDVTISKTTPNEEPKKTIFTILDGMTNEQILLYRNQQIEKFEKIGNGVFEVDETFVNALSPKAGALIIKEINEIFEAYPNITRSFIATHKKNNTKFVVKSEHIKSNDNGVTVASTNFDTMIFNSYVCKTAKTMWLSFKKSVDSGYHSPVDNIKLVESTVAHEMGHLISLILIYSEIKNYENYYTKCQKEYILHQHKSEYAQKFILKDKMPQIIKKDILKIARSQFNYKGNCHISEYGASHDHEWIAEVCSHALCSKKPNTLGLAFLKFLDDQETALSDTCLSEDEYYSQGDRDKVA